MYKLIHMNQSRRVSDDDLTGVLREPEAVYGVESVRSGLSMEEWAALRNWLGVSDERLAGWLLVSRATLHRRKKAGKMSPEESDRLMRNARLCRRAAAVLGGSVNARSWLLAPATAFGGECPLDYANTELGSREVEALLGRIEYGVFS